MKSMMHMTQRSQRFQRWAAGVALGALMSFAVQANTVLSNQAPQPDGGLYVSSDSVQNAESFQLGYAASISGVRWFGTDADVDDFTVRLFGSDPLVNPDTFTTLSGVAGATLVRSANPVMTGAGGGYQVYQYDLSFASAFSTAANQKVYVSIFNDGPTDWGWLDSLEGDGISAYRGVDGTAWSLGAPDLSLAVVGVTAVPEPGTYALMLGGLAALVAVTRRRQQLCAAGR